VIRHPFDGQDVLSAAFNFANLSTLICSRDPTLPKNRPLEGYPWLYRLRLFLDWSYCLPIRVEMGGNNRRIIFRF